MLHLQGSIVAIVTPMETNGELDENEFRRLIEWHLDSGTNGIVVNGTTGEAATLSRKERKTLIQIALELCAGKIPVLAGTGTNNTKTTIKRTKEAMELGVDGCLIVTPFYNKPTQTGLFEHFTAIAKNCDIPIVLYNVPGRTACDLLPRTVVELVKGRNIIGIKDATGDISRVEVLREQCGKDFALLSGDDKTALDFIQAGGNGVISVTANVVPKDMVELCKLALANDMDNASVLNEKLEMLHQVLMIESNPIPVKWMLAKMGLIKSGIRLPLTELSLKNRPLLQAALEKINMEQKMQEVIAGG